MLRGDNLAQHIPMHIRQPPLDAVVIKRQPLVIQP